MKKEELKMKDWKEKKFSQIFKVQSSKRVLKKDWKKKGVPFYRAREVVKLSEQGYVDNDLFISEELFNEYTQTSGKPKKDDIIISAVGTLGKCYIVKKEDKFYFKDASVLWLEKKDSNVDSRFIKYGFNTEILRNQIINNSLGATVGTLTIVKTRNLKIPLPPLHEQRRIVSKLDALFAEIDASLALIDQNIEQAEALKLSVLDEEFSMNNEKLKIKNDKLQNIVKIIGGGTPNKSIKKYYNGDIPWASVRDLNVVQLIKTEYYITSEAIENSSTNVIPKGNLIIATRVGLGKIVYNEIDVAINQDLKGLILSERIDRGFLFYFFKSIENFIIESGTGATVKGVKLNFIKSLKVPLPNLETQQKIVQKLDSVFTEVDGLITDYQSKREDLEALKASLLDSAFKGEL